MTRPHGIRRRPFALVAAVAAVALVLAACGGESGSSTTADSADSPAAPSDETTPSPEGTPSSDEPSDEPQVLTLAVTEPPVSLDPYLQNVDPQNNWFINLAYDPLIRIAPSGELEPVLATEWRFLDEENRQLEVTIREGVEFSDGETLTAEGVVASLQYAQASGVNAAAFWGTLETIEATGPNTVLLTSESPNPDLPTMLTSRVLLGSVVSPALLDNTDALRSSTYGAGPYILDTARTVDNDTYYYTPNPTYWAPDKVAWDEVVIKVVANPDAGLEAVRNGEADIIRGALSQYVAAENAGLAKEVVLIGLYGINILDRHGDSVPELGDPLVRQALAWAIDRAPIAEATFGAMGIEGGQLALPGTAGFDEEVNALYGYDPDRARQLLAEANVTDLTFQIAVDGTSPAAVTVLEAVQANWADIGVNAELITYTDRGQAVNDIVSGEYPVAFYAYGQLTPFVVISSFFGPANQFNALGSTDAELEALIDAARTASADEADAAIAAVHRYAQGDLAWTIGVLHGAGVYVHSDRITGVAHAPLAGSPDVAWYVIPAD